MKKILWIGKVLDSIIGLSLLFIGMYLFFWEHKFVDGAILFGANSLYSIDRILLKKLLKD